MTELALEHEPAAPQPPSVLLRQHSKCLLRHGQPSLPLRIVGQAEHDDPVELSPQGEAIATDVSDLGHGLEQRAVRRQQDHAATESVGDGLPA